MAGDRWPGRGSGVVLFVTTAAGRKSEADGLSVEGLNTLEHNNS